MRYEPINHIVVINGRPKIDDTGFTVQDIVAMHIWNNSSLEWIQEEFGLTLAQIYAALAYYYDHQAEIDELFRLDDEMWEPYAIETAEKLTKMRARLAEMKAEKGTAADE